jgi:hypothetical protein
MVKGAGHGRVRILHRCWLDRVPYDEARCLMALQKRTPAQARRSSF